MNPILVIDDIFLSGKIEMISIDATVCAAAAAAAATVVATIIIRNNRNYFTYIIHLIFLFTFYISFFI